MDTITTIQNLLTCNGSAHPVTVVLTQSETRLIAAAPDLLAALKLAFQALDAIGEEMTVGERYTNAGQYLIDSLNPARAAIKKAEGQS